MATEFFTSSSWPRAIMHVDGDAFFASCEQSVNPAYRNKPLVTGQERNIVAALSYEAKALGVKRGSPIWKARQLCPELIVLPSDYETYSLFSKRMFDIMRRFSASVEESSIDEGFAELTGLRRFSCLSYPELGMRIKRAIEKELAIPVSVGISLSKTLAKLAAKLEKPRGFTVVSGRDIVPFLKKNPVEEVCGIGPNSAALLKGRGVCTAYDFASMPEGHIKKYLGKIGVELYHELRGQAVYGLETEEKRDYKSILKSKTFAPPTNDAAFIKAHLLRNLESAFIKLRRYRLRSSCVDIFLKTEDFRAEGTTLEFNRATDNPLDLSSCVKSSFAGIFNFRQSYRSTGVVLRSLSSAGSTQFDLFEDPVKVIRSQRLSQVFDEAGKKYGKHAIFSGAGLYLKKKKHVRNIQPKRKLDLLKGETKRKRVRIPVICFKGV